MQDSSSHILMFLSSYIADKKINASNLPVFNELMSLYEHFH